MKRPLLAILAGGLALPVLLALAEDVKAPVAAKAPRDCAACHRAPAVGNQAAAWEKGPHAKAFQTLGSEAAAAVAKNAGVPGDPRQAADCLSCHAPLADRREAGVSCEVCHGVGDRYGGVCGESFPKAVDLGLKLSGEKDCVACHRPTAAHPEMEFEFALDADAIAHPLPAKDRETELFDTRGVYTRWTVFTEADGLPHRNVFGVTPHGNDVWVATENGVALYRGGKFTAWGVEDGLPHPAATQVAVDPKTGEAWVSTLCGIASFDGKTWTAYTQENSKLINNCAFGIAIFEDTVWVATFDGVSSYNRATKEWKNYYLDNAPLEEVWIYGLETNHEEVNFAVWGGGLVQYFPHQDYWETHHDPDGSFEMDLFQDDGIISQMITGASRDNGRVWVSSYFGMAMFDGRDWIENDMDSSGMLSNFANTVKARRSEGFYATDRGISSYDARRRRWVNYQKANGPGDYSEISIASRDGKERRSIRTKSSLPFNFVWAIAFQGEDIWVGTSGGLGRGRY